MPTKRRTTRFLSIGLGVLLIISAAQVAWWMLDQWRFIALVEERADRSDQEQVRAAERLLELGETPSAVERVLPAIRVDGRRVIVDPQRDTAQADERWHRLNQYGWEGGFFLLVLLGAVSVVARAVQQDAVLRRRQENFLAAASHELKSPLATALLAAEGLQRHDLAPEERGVKTSRIVRNLLRLESMISNLLDTVRLGEGRFVLRPAALHLQEALAPVMRNLEDNCGEAGVDLSVDLPGDLWVMADDEALRAVMRNLLDNALEALLETEQPRLSVDATRGAHDVSVVVRDNGCGFDPDDVDLLFEKFYRPGDELRRGGSGAGLGLHIAREVVVLSDGGITATSPGHGHGATFEVRWPLAAPPS